MLTHRTSIRGGRIIDPATGLDRVDDLHVADGRILSVGVPPDDFEAERVIHAQGKIVCPGLIDLCAYLREPGQEHKATIASETAAALSAPQLTVRELIEAGVHFGHQTHRWNPRMKPFLFGERNVLFSSACASLPANSGPRPSPAAVRLQNFRKLRRVMP